MSSKGVTPRKVLNVVAIIALALVAIFLASILISIPGGRARMEERRMEDAQIEAHSDRVYETCKDHVVQALKPTQVLDFVWDDEMGTRNTDTGYSYLLKADVGTKQIRVRCYLDHDYGFLKLAEIPY